MLTSEEQGLVAAVEDLARTKFAERAAEVDREGRFPAENVRDLQALNVPGMGMPREYGGGGMGPEARARVVEAVAYSCGSTAVALNMHFFAADTLLLNPRPNEAALAVNRAIASSEALMCAPGSIATSGLDTRTGGYRATDDGDALIINGKAGFASMSEGATYAFISGVVDRGPDNPVDLFFATPRMDTPGIKNLRNWDAMGLRGTASHDIEIEALRLPRTQALVVPTSFFETLNQVSASLPPAVRQGRVAGTLGIFAIWLGLSRAALDFSRDYVEKRYGALPVQAAADPAAAGLRADDAWAQIAIGRMTHWVESGRTLLYDFAGRLSEPYASPEDFNRALGVLLFHLRRMCEEVAMDAMKVCGAHAYVRNRPLERIHRDLVGCIAMAWKTDSVAQQLGLATLGRPFTIGGPIATA